MGLNTLVDKVFGQTIDASAVNDIHTAMKSDFVGRNDASGAPEAGKNLGTSLYPWGDTFITRLVLNGTTLSVSSLAGSPYKILDCRRRSASKDLPMFLQPSNITNQATLLATTTNLQIEARGVRGTFVADQILAGLTVAPVVNNTCTVNDTTAAAQAATRMWGEAVQNTNDDFLSLNKFITISAAGANITARVGTLQAFRIGTEPTAEYFLALVQSSTLLGPCLRGAFFDSTLAPRKRQTLTNGQTLTLMQASWVFADTDGLTLDTTPNSPKYQSSQPGSPTVGDYWFDVTASTWKRYNGATFTTVSRVLVGICVTDGTITRAARSIDIDAVHSADNFLFPNQQDNTTVYQRLPFGSISVFGSTLPIQETVPWTMVTNFGDSQDMYNTSTQASTNYYFYFSNRGELFISDIEPSFRPDLKGYFHPYNMWRCVYRAPTNASSQLTKGVALADLGLLTQGQLPENIRTSFPGASPPPSVVNSTTTFTTTTSSTITGVGRPILVSIAVGTVQGGILTVNATAPNGVTGDYILRRDGTTVLRRRFTVAGQSTNISDQIPLGEVFLDFPPSPGTYVYDIQIALVGATGGGRSMQWEGAINTIQL